MEIPHLADYSGLTDAHAPLMSDLTPEHDPDTRDWPRWGPDRQDVAEVDDRLERILAWLRNPKGTP